MTTPAYELGRLRALQKLGATTPIHAGMDKEVVTYRVLQELLKREDLLQHHKPIIKEIIAIVERDRPDVKNRI